MRMVKKYSDNLILLLRSRYWAGYKDLVRISVIWASVWTWKRFRIPSSILSRVVWQSIFTCLVLSWNTWLCTIRVAVVLSQNKTEGLKWSTWKFSNKHCSQTTWRVTNAKSRYFASAVEGETIFCFFDFQKTRESPRNILAK